MTRLHTVGCLLSTHAYDKEIIVPKLSERERIQALELKLKQLQVQQRKGARARTVESRRTRREEMRRKFLVGAIVLAKVEAGEIDETILRQWLHPALTKSDDRALFGSGDTT